MQVETKQIQAMHAMREATRLAAQGKYRCRICKKIDDQENGIIVVFASNVLLATCPGCIDSPIVITRKGGAIEVTYGKPEPSSIIQPSDLSTVPKLVLARPSVTKVQL